MSNTPDSLLSRSPQPGDGELIRPILETWVRDRTTGEVQTEEINGIIYAVEEAAVGEGDKKYLVAQSAGGQVLGLMGYTAPSEEMLPYSTTDRPTEIINAFVDKAARGQGVGSFLLQSLQRQAADQGYTELVVNSGPRYEDTAHAFYDSKLERVGIIPDLYGSGGDAPVWRQVLPIDEQN